MSQRDKKRIAINYKAQITRNYANIAARMFIKTRLEEKNRVIKKKAADKLGDIIKFYKNMRKTAN